MFVIIIARNIQKLEENHESNIIFAVKLFRIVVIDDTCVDVTSWWFI